MDIETLINQPDEMRDSSWEKEFLEVLTPQMKVLVLNERPMTGPDGMPYLLVELNESLESQSLGDVLVWLCENGIGLVLNPQKQVPDYVFTYGMVWYWRQTGKFLSVSGIGPMSASGSIQFRNGEEILIGPPSQVYLPNDAREILREFFLGIGVKTPKVLMIGKKDRPFDLCFSLESLGSPPASEHKEILERISWFFPQHYSLLLISEVGLPPFLAL